MYKLFGGAAIYRALCHKLIRAVNGCASVQPIQAWQNRVKRHHIVASWTV